MSCVAGLARCTEDKRMVAIAAESMATSGSLAVEEETPKISVIYDTRGYPYLVGSVESTRLTQIIDTYLIVQHSDLYFSDTRRHLVEHFVEPLQECLEEYGFSTVDHGRKFGGFLMVGVNGRLMTIQSDYQVSEPADGYDAIGNGSPIAIGAMFACTRYVDYQSYAPPKDVVETAIMATVKHDIYCGGKVTLGELNVYSNDRIYLRLTRGDVDLVQWTSGDRSRG